MSRPLPLPLARDWHTHLFPAELHPPQGAAWARHHGEENARQTLALDGGPRIQAWPNLEERLAALGSAGLGHAVLAGWYWQHPASADTQNRAMLAAALAHPGRFSVFATVVPSVATAPAQLAAALAAGAVGVGELHPGVQGWPAARAAWLKTLAVAAEAGAPILLHVTDPAGRAHPGKVETPFADLLDLLRALPRAKFILAHLGGGLALQPLSAEWEDALGERAWFDTSAVPRLYGEGALTAAITAVGRPRLLFGSDYPIRLYPKIDASAGLFRWVGKARAVGLLPPPESHAAVVSPRRATGPLAG